MKSGDPIIDRLCRRLHENACGEVAVLQLTERLIERSKAGQAKYGTTLARDDLTRKQWLQHGLEEALDLVAYLEVLIVRPDADTGLEYIQESALAVAIELQMRLTEN